MTVVWPSGTVMVSQERAKGVLKYLPFPADFPGKDIASESRSGYAGRSLCSRTQRDKEHHGTVAESGQHHLSAAPRIILLVCDTSPDPVFKVSAYT